jgi:hypothetical protein
MLREVVRDLPAAAREVLAPLAAERRELTSMPFALFSRHSRSAPC